MEAWESLHRHMLKQFLLHREHAPVLKYPDNLNHALERTLQEFENDQYDSLAIYSIIQSLIDEITGLEDDFISFIEKMSDQDDTWKVWSRFVLEDCMPYVALFISIRSENWHLRMAVVKLMAADFTAFDHPIDQKLITNHILDVMNMPKELLDYFKAGGFAVSITGRAFHSVGLDESHEMLINKDVKQAILKPSKEYRKSIIENF